MRLFSVTAAALTAGLAASAHATNIDFSFNNITGDVAGTVSGEIFGLVDNATSAATDILITSAPAGLGAGIPAAPFSIFAYATSLSQPIDVNSFTLAGGTLTAAAFQIFGGYFDLNLQPGNGSPFYNELVDPSAAFAVQNMDGLAGLTFSAVPEPMSMMLLMTGIVGIAAARRG